MLEKDIWLSTTVLSVGLARKVGEQDNRWETSACPFESLGLRSESGDKA